MKNRVRNVPKDSFIGMEPEMSCSARLSFQYPRGTDGLNRHQDPYDYHQITVPAVVMSKKGEDFEHGGAYVDKTDSDRIPSIRFFRISFNYYKEEWYNEDYCG